MSRLHILTKSGNNVYSVVCHAPTPVGNNLAGVLWSDAIKNSGAAVTQMTVGNGPGQIATAEANQVTAGSVIEAGFQWQNDPAWNATQRNADLATRAQQAVDGAVADLQSRLQYFGMTVA
jgi:hypothetical protein